MAKKQEQPKPWSPPVAFYFLVEFAKKSEIFDMAFMEVSGLSVEMETEEVEEGGESRFKYRIPIRQKHGNLVCKRALYPLKDSPLAKWVKTVMDGDFSQKIQVSNVFISLLDGEGKKISGWFLTGVYPLKWDLAPFDAKKNDLAIETIEFVYNTIERKL